MTRSSVCHTSSEAADAANHARRAVGTGVPSKLASIASSSAEARRLNGRRRSAAVMRASVISRLLSWNLERVDLDDRDALTAETDADRRLADGQAGELVGADEIGLAAAQEAAYDRSGGAELDLADDLGSAARAERARQRVRVLRRTDLMHQQRTRTHQCLTKHLIARQLLGRDDDRQTRLTRLQQQIDQLDGVAERSELVEHDEPGLRRVGPQSLVGDLL